MVCPILLYFLAFQSGYRGGEFHYYASKFGLFAWIIGCMSLSCMKLQFRTLFAISIKVRLMKKTRTKIIRVSVPLGMQTSGLLQTVNYLERHETTAGEQEAAT